MAEQVYLDRNGVRITSARAIFGNKTYVLVQDQVAGFANSGWGLHP